MLVAGGGSEHNGTNVSKMCQIVLKYMLKYRRNDPDKLNLSPFYHLTFKCVLDL